MLSSLKLFSKTPIGKDEQKKLKNILQSLLTSNDSIEFRVPVDWKALNLLDYCVLIKNPMDLGTINKRCNEQGYLYVEEVLDDIQLVWDNCKTYNPPNSWIYTLAEKLERSFKKMVKNYLPHIAITVPGRNPTLTKEDKKPSFTQAQPEKEDKEEPSYTDKQKLSQRLRGLTPTDLGTIVQQMIDKYPMLYKEVNDENSQLLLDNMTATSYREFNELIDRSLYGKEGYDRVSKRIKE